MAGYNIPASGPGSGNETLSGWLGVHKADHIGLQAGGDHGAEHPECLKRINAVVFGDHLLAESFRECQSRIIRSTLIAERLYVVHTNTM